MTDAEPAADELLDITTALVQELARQHTAGEVITCVVRCRDLLETAGVRAGLATAAVAMARARLAFAAS